MMKCRESSMRMIFRFGVPLYAVVYSAVTLAGSGCLIGSTG